MAFAPISPLFPFTFTCPPMLRYCFEQSELNVKSEHVPSSKAPFSRKRVAKQNGARDHSCKRFKPAKKRHVLDLSEVVAPFDVASYDAHASEAQVYRLYHQTALDRIDELEIELSDQRFASLTAVAARHKIEAERAESRSTLESTKGQLNAAKSAAAKAEKERDGMKERLIKADLQVQDTAQRLGKANDALKKKSAPESEIKRSFEAERHRLNSAQSRLTRQVKDKDDEIRRLKAFGENNRTLIKELNQQLDAARNEISVLKSEPAGSNDIVQDTEMVGGVAEKGSEHLTAELEDLRKQNAALKKKKEENEEIRKQQVQEIEQLRPEDEPMTEASKLAVVEDAQQDSSDVESTNAAAQAVQEPYSKPASETIHHDPTVPPTPESLSSSLMGERTSMSENLGEETDSDLKTLNANMQNNEQTMVSSNKGAPTTPTSIGGFKVPNRGTKKTEQRRGKVQINEGRSQTNGISKQSLRAPQENKARNSVLAQKLQKAEERSPGVISEQFEEMEAQKLVEQLHEEMRAINALEDEKEGYDDSSKGLEKRIWELQRVYQRKYERYMILTKALDRESTAKELDELVRNFKGSVSTKDVKTKAQIEAEDDYGDDEDGEDDEKEL